MKSPQEIYFLVWYDILSRVSRENLLAYITPEKHFLRSWVKADAETSSA
jgi:hypothetical protein